MKILLIETNSAGHAITLYLNALIDKLRSNQNDIIVLTAAESKKKSTLDYLKKKKVKIIYLNKYYKINSTNPIAILFNEIKLYYLIKNKFKEMHDIDHVFLNSFNVIDKAISILGTPFSNTKFSGIIPEKKFNYNYKKYSLLTLRNLIDKFLFNRLIKIKELLAVFIPDPIFIKYSKKNIFNHHKLFVSSDFGFFNTGIKKLQKTKIINNELVSIFKKKEFVILVYGAIRYGKGIHFLLEAVKKSNIKKKFKIIIAGKQDNPTKKIIDTYKKDSKFKDILITLNHFISIDLQDYLFRKTSVIWTGTTKNYYGSSGVFFLSAKYKKPVITSDHGLINLYTKKYKIGYRVEIDNINKIKKLLKNVLSGSKKIPNSYFKKVNQSHNSEIFSENIIRKLNLKFIRF